MSESSVKKIPARSEIAQHETWDLTPVFASDEAWETAFANYSADLANMPSYEGRLGESAVTMLQAITDVHELGRRLALLHVYAHLKRDEDTSASIYNGLYSRVLQLTTVFQAKVAYIEPELTALPGGVIERFLAEEPGLDAYRHYLDDLIRRKPHVLSAESETLLAGASQVLNASSYIFSVLDSSDLLFPTIKGADGVDVEITHSNFIQLLENRDRRVRREAFDAYYSVYRQFRNTFAATLGGSVASDNYLARVHHFSDARAAAMFDNAIPESVHDQLVKTVGEQSHLLHRYVHLRKTRLGLEELQPYDLYTSIVPDVDLTYTFDQAFDLVQKALMPFGDEYQTILKKARAERWIDYADNRGKRSGAYSNGTYGTYPYILMSWGGTLNDVFTLVHELGHSVHSYYSRSTQPFQYSHYSIFLAEIASTTNELLLIEYMLEHETDPLVRAYGINHKLDAFKGTVLRQTQFAEFEHLIPQAEQEGTAMTAEWLCQEYARINRAYYGDGLTLNENISLEWARIPHFTTTTMSISMRPAFRQQRPSCAEFWLKARLCRALQNFLKAGSSRYPSMFSNKRVLT